MKRLIALTALIALVSLPLSARKSRSVRIDRSDGRKMKVIVLTPDKPADTLRTGILWIHGGGYVTGMAAMVRMMGRPGPLVDKYDAVVISPEYRLARRGRYPNAIEDCYDALRYMVTHADELGIRSDQIFVGGESAGGGLTAALCMLARDRGEFNIAFQMPLYPMIDDRDTESSRDNRNKVWNTKRNHFGWRTYLGPLYGTDSVPPYAAAARQTDYSLLPPAYTFVCTDEPFYSETLTFIDHLSAAGVEASVDVYEGLYHAFDMLQPRLEVSKQAAARFEEAYLYAKARYFRAQPAAGR